MFWGMRRSKVLGVDARYIHTHVPIWVLKMEKELGFEFGLPCSFGMLGYLLGR